MLRARGIAAALRRSPLVGADLDPLTGAAGEREPGLDHEAEA